jgi:hypothetical protein
MSTKKCAISTNVSGVSEAAHRAVCRCAGIAVFVFFFESGHIDPVLNKPVYGVPERAGNNGFSTDSLCEEF